jgi:hypothetical protein
MNYPRFIYSLGFLVSASLGGSLMAAESVAAVQNRLYDKSHQISVQSSYVADDPFHMNYPISAGYTWHLNSWLGWEVARGTYFVNKKRALQDTLIDEFEAAPSDFDYPIYAIHSALVLKPTYGKDSWFNRVVMHHQTSVSVGGGLTTYQKDYHYGESTQETAWSVRLGAKRSYFLNKSLALTLELAETIDFKEEGLSYDFSVGGGFDVRFNLFNSNVDENELDKLYQFLESQ